MKSDRAELILKKLFKNRVPQCIISALDLTYYDCYAGGPDEEVHRHCLLSKDHSRNLSYPKDTGLSPPVCKIEKEECYIYILDQLTQNFS